MTTPEYAFPQSETLYEDGAVLAREQCRGMTLREWFAGQALVGLPALCAHDTLIKGETFEQHIARNAYRMADAMLAAREATK